MIDKKTHKFFAPCPRGLEGILRAELEALGATELAVAEGGVGFDGPLLLACLVNLHSRIASRVLWEIGAGHYRNEEDVYRGVAALDWQRLFSPDLNIRVKVSAIASPLRSLDFITLRIKDAVCDKMRAQTGRRPSVDTARPDVRIHAFLDAQRFTIYLDTSGEPLFKRRTRLYSGEAPMRENLAAGILMLAGWAPGISLLDPMCGSGTLLIEAAQMALSVAPGLRREFGFGKLFGFDAASWTRIRTEAESAVKKTVALPIHGSDLYGDALKLARQNLEAAGLAEAVSLNQANILEISAPAPEGLLVTNPPYGIRVGEQDNLATFYPQLGDTLKKKFAGWRAYVFTADMRLPKLIGLSPSRRTPLYNGPLESRLYEFRMVAGSMRKKRKQ